MYYGLSCKLFIYSEQRRGSTNCFTNQGTFICVIFLKVVLTNILSEYVDQLHRSINLLGSEFPFTFVYFQFVNL